MIVMSSAERREREREELRRLILDTTLELFSCEDHEKVSMRRIAEKINYSPTAIYLHFKDKGELMDALATEGYGMLADAVEAVQADDPVERLQRIGDAYVSFAFANPAICRLMFVFGDRTQDLYEGHNTHRMASARVFDHLADVVGEVKRASKPDNGAPVYKPAPAEDHDEVTLAAAVFWAHIHGAVALVLAGRNRRVAGRKPQFFRKAIDTAVAGLLVEMKA